MEEILKKIVPNKEEEKKIYEIINEFIEKLKDSGLEPFLGGSFGKGTWLKGQSDVDIFILFEDNENISNILESNIKELGLNYIKIHGSRDYFKVYYKGLEFELVPILKINKPEEAKNITDISPFHVKYIKKKLEDNPKLVNEIRLLKAFMKGIGTYGAESYIKGFSGYACELLIIYYKSFLNLIKDASKWRPKVIIDIEKIYKSKKEIFEKVDKNRLKSPIIIIDPVYPIRNATASVSTKTFSKFIFYSRRFLENPNETFFFPQEKNDNYYLEKSKIAGTKLIKFEIIGKGNNLDVKNVKILKFLEFIKKQLEILGFKVLDFDIIFQKNLNDKGKVYLFIYPERLPKYETRLGPPVWIYENSEKFYKKWKNYEIKITEDGRLLAMVPRRIRNIEEAIRFIFDKHKENIKDKVEWITYDIY